ncbi:hypothetical protein Taro_015743 [Colocasia esculenta]|uniref:Uncharacterized protein n=1 Tax=Colocasia esculenta TaxID=4460 RepID=A0A843UN89_COLES|nr:hypothetical protein [Colocasia esculenta]
MSVDSVTSYASRASPASRSACCCMTSSMSVSPMTALPSSIASEAQKVQRSGLALMFPSCLDEELHEKVEKDLTGL